MRLEKKRKEKQRGEQRVADRKTHVISSENEGGGDDGAGGDEAPTDDEDEEEAATAPPAAAEDDEDEDDAEAFRHSRPMTSSQRAGGTRDWKERRWCSSTAPTSSASPSSAF